MQQTVEHLHIRPGKVKALALDAADISMDTMSELRTLGISLDKLLSKSALTAMDSLQPTVTTGSITTPVQFLQNWLPGFVAVLTAPRKIDDAIGITTAGAWEDEEVVQGIMELTGTSVPYGDYSNIPLSSWNVNFERRTNVRFEEGMAVGSLEEARAARMNANSAAWKRESAALALEIQRNAVGFYGFNNGANRTYGLLNDPSLLPYTSVAANQAGDTEWSKKDYLDIVGDLKSMASQLRSQSQDTIDPNSQACTLLVATDAVDFLSTPSQFGNSVQDFIKTTYPNWRIVSAPQLNAANAGDNVVYLYADAVSGDGSTDGSRTWVQIVPAKFKALGVQALAKGYKEDYSNATAGAMCKRPFAVVRKYGI